MLYILNLVYDFNPLHREGGDSVTRILQSVSRNFNPLHREGGDCQSPVPASTSGHNFNPLHREGGDLTLFQPREAAKVISIHSTARVETSIMWPAQKLPHISIHSTARVETINLTPDLSLIGYFNPLHREGGDPPGQFSVNPHLEFQSTPPRGWRRWIS